MQGCITSDDEMALVQELYSIQYRKLTQYSHSRSCRQNTRSSECTLIIRIITSIQFDNVEVISISIAGHRIPHVRSDTSVIEEQSGVSVAVHVLPPFGMEAPELAPFAAQCNRVI